MVRTFRPWSRLGGAIGIAMLGLATEPAMAETEHQPGGTASTGSGRAPAPERFSLFGGSRSSFRQVVRLSIVGGGGCSATIVGEKTLLTAAHCFDGGPGTATFRLDGRRFQVTCRSHPDYLRVRFRGGQLVGDNDVAACTSNEVIDGVPPACIGRPLSRGQKALIIGFGETNGSGPSGRAFDGQQRSGEVTVTRVPGQLIRSTHYFAGDNSGVVAGFGDSGGFAGSEVDGQLFIAGINATSSGYTEVNGQLVFRGAGGTSFASTTAPANRDFLRTFSEERGVSICGLDGAGPSAPRPETRPETRPEPERPRPPAELPPLAPADSASRNFRLGATVAEGSLGPVVRGMLADSLAGRSGILAGEQIVGINGTRVRSVPELVGALQRFRALGVSGRTLLVHVMSGSGQLRAVRIAVR